MELLWCWDDQDFSAESWPSEKQPANYDINKNCLVMDFNQMQIF
jgi:hypothetical protein